MFVCTNSMVIPVWACKVDNKSIPTYKNDPNKEVPYWKPAMDCVDVPRREVRVTNDEIFYVDVYDDGHEERVF